LANTALGEENSPNGGYSNMNLVIRPTKITAADI
jgi:hypothetical protein